MHTSAIYVYTCTAGRKLYRTSAPEESPGLVFYPPVDSGKKVGGSTQPVLFFSFLLPPQMVLDPPLPSLPTDLHSRHTLSLPRQCKASVGSGNGLERKGVGEGPNGPKNGKGNVGSGAGPILLPTLREAKNIPSIDLSLLRHRSV